MFIKIKYIHAIKILKIGEETSYDQFEQMTREKFPELENFPIKFVDLDSAEVDKDIFKEYVFSMQNPILVVVKIRDEDPSTSRSTSNSTISVISLNEPSTNSILGEDVSSENNSINIGELPIIFDIDTVGQSIEAAMTSSKCNLTISDRKSLTVEEWRQLILNRIGPQIFDYYEKNGLLSTKLRIKLVNCTYAALAEMFGLKVPESAKRELASAIISIFPKLRDPMGQYGYEAFYKNENGGEGFIAWRERTVHRNNKNYGSSPVPKRKRKIETSDNNNSKKNKSLSSTHCELNDEIELAINFMKNANPTTDKNAILEKMTICHNYKNSLGLETLGVFPRFLDTPDLIEHDYLLDHPKSDFCTVFTIEHAQKVLAIYKTSVANPNPNLLEEDENNDACDNEKFDICTRAVLALCRMLPTSKKKCDVKGEIEENLIVFNKINQPTSDTISKQISTQPYLLACGSHKSAITNYSVVLDNKVLPCPRLCTSVKAFEVLFMTHFVFNVEYNSYISSFWQFMETFYFKIKPEQPVFYTPKMCELRTKLSNVM